MKQHVNVPSTVGSLTNWLSRALAATETIEKIVKMGTEFANRGGHDLREYEKDKEGFPTGDRVEGSFFDHPARGMLWQGTEDERRRGLFFEPRKEDDGTDLTAIHPFSETSLFGLTNPLPLPMEGGTRLSNGTYAESSPLELPYQRLVEALGIKPLARAFAVNGHQGECGAFYFPMTWGKEKDLYFKVEINTRYGDLYYSFFQGDPELSCSLRPRAPRQHEFDEYFRARREGGPRTWGAKELPNIIPITFDTTSEQRWKDPQPIELRNIIQANGSLRFMKDSTGQAPWLYGGG